MFSDKELGVLSYILANIERGGVFKGTLDEISKATGIDKKEVRQILDELAEKGYISLINTRTVLQRLSINIEDIVSCIDSLIVNEEDNRCKDIIGNLWRYNNAYRYRNNLLREIGKITSIDEFIQVIDELYRLERMLKKYRIIIETEIRSILQQAIASIMPPEEKLLVKHKLIVKCFPILINSIERVSREELSPKEIQLYGLGKANVEHIYKIDEQLLGILVSILNRAIKNIVLFMENKKLDKANMMKALYVIFSLKKDIELINLIKEVLHGM